jgi:hypothetical protein
LLSLVQANVFAALVEHAGGSDPRANRCPDCSAYSTAGDGADDRANACGRPNFCYVIFG